MLQWFERQYEECSHCRGRGAFNNLKTGGDNACLSCEGKGYKEFTQFGRVLKYGALGFLFIFFVGSMIHSCST